jgi:hypothetical protein
MRSSAARSCTGNFTLGGFGRRSGSNEICSRKHVSGQTGSARESSSIAISTVDRLLISARSPTWKLRHVCTSVSIWARPPSRRCCVDDAGEVRASASTRSRYRIRRPGWSEQDPATWWSGDARHRRGCGCLPMRKSTASLPMRSAAIGLSGQMHGATLLDASPTTSCDRRFCGMTAASDVECARNWSRYLNFREITGNLAMPGFTAPKLALDTQARARGVRVASPRYCCRRITCACCSPAST